MKWSILLAFCFVSASLNAQRIFRGEIVYSAVHGFEQATYKLSAGEKHRRLDMFRGDTLSDYFLVLGGDTSFYHIDVSDKVIIKMGLLDGPFLKPVADAGLKDTTILGNHCTPQKYAVLFNEDNSSGEMYVINWYATGLRFSGGYKGNTGLTPIEDSMVVLMQQMVFVSSKHANDAIVETTFMVQKISSNAPAETAFQLPTGYAVEHTPKFGQLIVTDVELVEIKNGNEEDLPPPPPPPPGKKKKKN